jgi:hypothetical protein
MFINNVKYSHVVFNVYACFLVVLWTFINYGASGISPYGASDYRWYIITITFFVFLMAIIPTIKLDYISHSQFFLLCYLLIVFLSSIVLLDPKHLYEAVKLALPLWFIFQFKPVINLKIINYLYFIVLVGGIFVYSFDPGDYGVLPGQTTVNLHQGLWWRISIWNYKTPPYSAALSILVFFTNLYFNTSKFKYAFCALSLYFILFSASRTGYLIFLVGVLLYFLPKFLNFKLRKFYIFLPVLLSLFMFLLQYFSNFLLYLNLENEILTSMILRQDETSSDTSNLSSRFLIVKEQMSLFFNSNDIPLFGIGSDVYNSSHWTINGGHLGGTNDSFLTHVLVRDGIASIFLSFVFVNQFYNSMVEKNIFTFTILTILMIYCIGYGAWLNFNSPVFILYCGCLYLNNNIKGTSKK